MHPCRVVRRSEADNQRIRDRMHIVCDGAAIPPPITNFAAMRLPRATTAALAADGIAAPTPIQAQGLPVLLSGRDCVGISSTGSGKTLVFVLPMLMHALQVRRGACASPAAPRLHALLPAATPCVFAGRLHSRCELPPQQQTLLQSCAMA